MCWAFANNLEWEYIEPLKRPSAPRAAQAAPQLCRADGSRPCAALAALALPSLHPRLYPGSWNTPLAHVVTDDVSWRAFRYRQEACLSRGCSRSAPSVLSCSPPFPLGNAIAQPGLGCPNAAQLLHEYAALSQPMRPKNKVCSSGSLE